MRRELRVFEFLDFQASWPLPNAEYLMEYVVAVLKGVEIKGSGGQAEDLIGEFLGRQSARLFLHELNNWLRSPYSTLAEYDRNVQYHECDYQ